MGRQFDLTGKRSLVTGGGRGIGRAIALALADAGADVAITSRKAGDAEPVARDIRAKGRRSIELALDVRSVASIRACFDRLATEWGTIDIVVNNAGTNIPTDLASLDEAGWDTVVDTDLKGVAFVTQAAIPVLRDGGRVINVASIYGVMGRVDRVAYSAAKGGVVTLTKSLALELAPRGITVNAVGPSLIETDLTRERMRKDPAFRDVEVARTPLGRLGTAADVLGRSCISPLPRPASSPVNSCSSTEGPAPTSKALIPRQYVSTPPRSIWSRRVMSQTGLRPTN